MTLPHADELDPAEIARRVRRYARTLDWRVYWPELSPAAFDDARGAIERVVLRVINGDRLVPLRLSDNYAANIAAFTNGVAALLAQWANQGEVVLEAPLRAQLDVHLDEGRRRAQQARGLVLAALDALRARGIPPVVIKGFHLAHAYYVDPGVRPFSDVDIIVPAARRVDAETTLEALHYRLVRRSAQNKSEWLAPTVDPRLFSLERNDARSRWQLELHESFDRDFAGVFFARLDSYQAHVMPFTIDGRSLLAPTQPLLLLVLACQLSSELNAIRLMRVIDVVTVLRADAASGALNWSDVCNAMTRIGPRFAYPALALADQLAPGSVHESALSLARADASWALRNVVDSLQLSAGFARRTTLLRGLMWAENPSHVVRGFSAAVRLRLARWMRQSE